MPNSEIAVSGQKSAYYQTSLGIKFLRSYVSGNGVKNPSKGWSLGPYVPHKL